MLLVHRVPPCWGADAGEIRGHSVPFVDNDNISPRDMSWQATIRSQPHTCGTGGSRLDRRWLSGEEPGGVSNQLGKDDLGSAYHQLIRPECCILDLHRLTRRPDRLADERSVVRRRAVQGGEKPGEHDDAGVEPVSYTHLTLPT